MVSKLVLRLALLLFLLPLAPQAYSEGMAAIATQPDIAVLVSSTLIAVDEDAAEDGGAANPEKDAQEDAGIPGAIVALIFGVFGLLVVARRNVR